ETKGRPGEMISSKDKLIIAARDGAIDVLKLQLEDKKVMTAAEFLRGHALQTGTLLEGKQQ
ncbi:MAG: methionyl-tRNA formyltransferase, partial [Thermoplasmata archaeon]|nr:methionyl-tRNA formyltransferase [Thermoplasmata archaeon]